MNNILESRNTPWQALQRSLATALGSADKPSGHLNPGGAAFKGADAASWLIRARSAVAPSHQPIR